MGSAEKGALSGRAGFRLCFLLQHIRNGRLVNQKSMVSESSGFAWLPLNVSIVVEVAKDRLT